LAQARDQLEVFVELVQGMNNKIRVRGHAARVPLATIAPFGGLDELSYARADAVKRHLVERGIRPERITTEACGDAEPLNLQAYDEAGRALNRRVEIILLEGLVEDYQGGGEPDQEDLIDG
jgi:flagellar motor protein MotB